MKERTRLRRRWGGRGLRLEFDQWQEERIAVRLKVVAEKQSDTKAEEEEEEVILLFSG